MTSWQRTAPSTTLWTSLILGGEGDVHVELLAGRVTNDLLLKAGDEAAAAQSQVVAQEQPGAAGQAG